MYFSRIQVRSDIKELSELASLLKNDNYGVHRLLWRLFPGQEQRTFLFREEIAHEQLGPSPSVRGQPIYYLVSQTKPVAEACSLFTIESKDYRPQLQNGQKLGFDCRVNPVIARQGKKHDVVMDAQLQFLQVLVNSSRLQSSLPPKPDKGAYKKLLLAEGGEALNDRLTETLANDRRYAERLRQISTMADKLEWTIKAHIDTILENWMTRQGKQHGFDLVTDDSGVSKLQNSAYVWRGLNSKGKKAGFSSVDFTGQLQIIDVDKFEQALYKGIGRSKAFGCGLLMIRKI